MFALVVDAIRTKKKPSITPMVMGVLLFIMVLNTPFSVGICKMPTMACHDTALWLKLASVLAICAGITGFKKESKEN